MYNYHDWSEYNQLWQRQVCQNTAQNYKRLIFKTGNSESAFISRDEIL
jgi:hypothetical protein